MYDAKMIADSISPEGVRLTTMEVTYPRFVHTEFMTHRMFSRNAASSRAIPIQKMIQAVLDDPVMPVWWGKNQAGMQAREELEGEALILAGERWLQARDEAIEWVGCLADIGLHKQIANRLLEPWMWITVIVSATDWANFFHLRCHPDAQPEIQKIAYMMRDLYYSHEPEEATVHLPYIYPEDCEPPRTLYDLKKISVGRCARVSYLTHDGKRDPQADIDLCNRLILSGHWSPFEHVAQSTSKPGYFGNFRGWYQYRKEFKDENCTADAYTDREGNPQAYATDRSGGI